ncbi:MAG: hyperosmotically inducible protein [Glaciecola sp.]|jgi:hyperosmotically inducible protein
MKRTLISLALITGLSLPAMAATNSWEKEAMDAWIDGKAEATLLFNGNLNSFDINTDVKMGTITLTGKVDNEIEKELAEELVVSIEGVKDVQNNLTVFNPDMKQESEQASNFTDAKINTVITSRLIFESEVSGLDIDVDVDDRKVTLNGKVDSDAERDLIVAIAENTNDVASVTDNLEIEAVSE